MGRGRPKKKFIFEIPEPGMADIDDDDLPTLTSTPEPVETIEPVEVKPKKKSEPEKEYPDEPVEVKPKKKSEPEKEYPDSEYWRQDGKRYDVSLQDHKEKNKYQSFDESENLADAKELANNAAFEDGREATVWDRKIGSFVYRIDPNAPLEEEEKTTKKKGKK